MIKPFAFHLCEQNEMYDITKIKHSIAGVQIWHIQEHNICK